MADRIEDHRRTVSSSAARPTGHGWMVGIAGSRRGDPGFAHIGLHMPRFGSAVIVIDIAGNKAGFRSVSRFQHIACLKRKNIHVDGCLLSRDLSFRQPNGAHPKMLGGDGNPRIPRAGIGTGLPIGLKNPILVVAEPARNTFFQFEIRE